MMSSNEIAQMFAAQNSSFAGQGAFASQIGVSAPGAWGAPPGFSYGGPGVGAPGMNGGNRFAGAAMSGMGAGVSIAGAGIGVLGMAGRLGVAAPAVDPFSAFGAARAMGMGVGGSLGMAAVPLAGGMYASHLASSFVHGGQQQQMIGNQLGGFNMMNSQSRSGFGFSRDQTQAIGDQVRQLAHIPELMTSVEELTKLMPKLKGAGMMQGVKDASEFSKRFKEAVSTIRDVSKVLGTTMEEASEFFSHSRSVGFMGHTAQLKNALSTQLTSGVTGMSTGQVMQMQTAGANLATQFGTKRSIGARSITNVAQNLGFAQREGLISEGLLEDVTGLQGADAVQAGAERMTQIMARMSQTPVGRLQMAGMVKFDENGRAVGIDEGLAKRLNAGTLSTAELKKRAQGLTRDQKVSFTARSGTLAVDLAGKVGPGGMATMMNNLIGNTYGEEGTNLLMQKYGFSESEADLAMQMRGSDAGGAMENMKRLKARESGIREKTDPGAVLKRIKTRLHGAMGFAGAEQKGSEVFTAIGRAHDEFVDDLVGRHVVTVSKEGADALAKALSGSGKQELKEMFSAAYGLKGRDLKSKPSRATFGNLIAGRLATAGPLGMVAAGVDQMMGGGGFDSVAGKIDGLLGGGRLGDTELGAWALRGNNDTGRSDSSQFRHIQGLLGVGAGDVTGTLGKLSSGGTAGRISAGSASGAKALIQKIIDENPEFRKMDDSRKLDFLRGELQDRVWKASSKGDRSVFSKDDALGAFDVGGKGMQRLSGTDEGALISALQETQGNLSAAGASTDVYTELIAQVQDGKGRNDLVNFSRTADAGSSSRFLSIRHREGQRRDSLEKLRKAGVSPATIDLIRDSKTARRVLMDKSEAVNAALSTEDDNEALSALAKLGYNVSPKELAALRDANDNIRQKTAAGNEVGSALGIFETMQQAESTDAMLGSFRETGAEIIQASKDVKGAGAATAVGEALSDLSRIEGATPEEEESNFDKKFDKAQAAITELTRKISTTRDPEERAKLIAAAGRIGATIGGTVGQGDTLRNKKVDAAHIARTFGMSADDEQFKTIMAESGISLSGKTTLSDSMVDSVTSRIGGLKTAGQIAKAGQQDMAGAKDEQLMKTLKAIDKNSHLQTTILTQIAAKVTGESAETITVTAQDSYRETSENRNVQGSGWE